MSLTSIAEHFTAIVLALALENWWLSRKRFHKRPDGDTELV
jgi:hypothetical protein